MKYTSAVAAAALLGSASAGVHKMKLKKVPLSEQFVSRHTIADALNDFANKSYRSTQTLDSTLARSARSTSVQARKTPSKTPASRLRRIIQSQSRTF